ncbi:transposase domain-containing protein [Ochrobactrum teleogrylli]|uniref:DDE-type integrase/transposase/recombinase n=1 Tax=Ochrobactrum teleogrylli TaxID=2479765 RepID=A0ABY2Y7R3_9HYPH|nr:transposase domain-containing protein [[Ochrobactrum] teleogrylli]TNV17766.1 DDE-type integrase/transposase/recombinase [[Ochrobactrum] teleogrylli]
MKEWFTIAELATVGLPDLPTSEKGLDKVFRRKRQANPELARRENGKTKPTWEYHISLLPKSAQTRLIVVHDAPANDDRDLHTAKKAALWARYEGLSMEHKARCERRLEALRFADELISLSGLKVNVAMELARSRFNVGIRSLYSWWSLVEGCDRSDWLAALAPSFASNAQRSECHDEAWDFLTSDYLRPERPSFSACYRRMVKVAAKRNWSPVPSERALRRRLDAEVTDAVQTLAREGKEKAKTLYPAQRRTRTHLHAMQMVNMDGHKIDVFVKVPWSETPVRMYMLVIQDLYSGKIVAWRLSDAETWEAVRLVIGDMVETYGIPDDIYLDNGRAFASKWISGGSVTRFRFKVKEEDPRGLLTTLGVNMHWTTPYSGQSKPIERAFRDLADMIAKHPFCAGAYTGNRPDAKPENYASRAVPLEDFRMHVAAQIADHNAQAGRRAVNCAGRSFDETFLASMETAIVRWPTAAQKSLWLLASEVLRTKKGSGEVHFQGNRYWSLELNQWAGQKVTIRFDPDNLHTSIKVYDMKNVLICDAPCIADAGFNDLDAARTHSRARRDYQKSLQAAADAKRKLSAQQLGELIYQGEKTAKAPEMVRPKVTRIAHGNLAMKEETAVDAISQQKFEDGFARAMRKLAGEEPSVIQFPQGKHEPVSSEYGSKKKGGSDPAR